MYQPNMITDMPRVKQCFALGFALLCVSLTQLSCTSDPVTPETSDSGLIPLNSGNHWKFRRTYYDVQGNATLVESDVAAIVIQTDTVISRETWFYQRYLGHKLAYRNSSSGVEVRLVSPNTTAKVFLRYKYPANTGDTFPYPEVYFSGFNAWLVDSAYVAKVISTDTLITVPAGSFHCYQYRTQHTLNVSSWRDKFVAPEFGWIKEEVYTRDPASGSILKANAVELSGYSFNR